MTEEPKSIWDIAAELGEGPVWVDGRLWFVDIKKRQVHRFDPASGERRSWSATEQVGFVLPRRGGGMVAGLQSGLHHFDPNAGTFAPIVAVEPDKPGNRLNDGVVDPDGNIWFGTMDDGENVRTGAFYRFDGERVTPTGIDGIAITNGPAVSPDGRTLYFVDTVERTISAAPIAHDGTLGAAREIVRIAEGEGFPDGPTIDSEGAVWISLYHGWEARRYSPEGDLLQRVRFPVSNITKIAFGGDDLRTAFATTARQKMSADEIAKQPEIGDLFAFRVDVPGVPCPLAR